MKMSLPSASKKEVDAIAVIPVYPKSDGDEVLVNATVLNEDDEAVSNNRDEVNVRNALEVTIDDDDEDCSVACAVVVAADIDNDDSTLLKDLRSSQTVIKADDRKNTASSSRKSGKRKRTEAIPSFKDLGIPFRAIKRIMKIDPDIMVVQNEAAMITTFALELFVKKIVNESYNNAKKRGRNTVK